MKIEKVIVSGSKPLWAIVLDNGKKYGEYTDDAGFIRFEAWTLKKHALRMLDILQNGKAFEKFCGAI